VLDEALWAWMLEIGSGVATNLHAAAEYYGYAAEKGLEEAEPGLERCECWEHAEAL
jgi:TPR repeat protein